MKGMGYALWAIAVIGMSSCTFNQPILPEAKRVTITNTNPAHRCKFIGDLYAYDINGHSHVFTSLAHLHKDGLIKLRNQAAEMHANTVYITEHEVRWQRRHHRPEQHTFKGKAYYCR